MHFVNPAVFDPIVPPYLGAPRFWVLLTGVTEVALGLGVMWSQTRRWASILMVGQLCLLYLANLHMWMNSIPFDGVSLGTAGHVIRLFVQVLLVGMAAWVGQLWPFRPGLERPQPE